MRRQLGKTRALLAAVAIVMVPSAGATAQCEQVWDTGFLPGRFATDLSPIAVVEVGDDLQVFATGGDPRATTSEIRNPLYWDGETWSYRPGGIFGEPGTFPRFVHAPHEPGRAYVYGRQIRLPNGSSATMARWEDGMWVPFGGGGEPSLVTVGPVTAPETLVWIRNTFGAHRLVVHDGQTSTVIAHLDKLAPPTSMVWFNDGSGAKLHVFGPFGTLDGLPIRGAAVWDGRAWSELAALPGESLYGAVTFDDGTGPAVYALSSNQKAVYRWDGAEWTTRRTLSGRFDWLGVIDLGDGECLVTSWIEFDTEQTTLWEWTPTEWQPLPHVFDGRVRSMVTRQTADGPRTFTAGEFVSVNGVPACNIAVWDGSNWSDVGSGFTGNGLHQAGHLLFVGEENGAALGPRLYAAMRMPGAGLLHGSDRLGGVARWDGTTWETLDFGPITQYEELNVMALLDLGEGPRVVVGGDFGMAEHGFESIAQFDGHGWTSVGSPEQVVGTVLDLETMDTGLGPKLFAAGQLWVRPDNGSQLAVFDGEDWHSVAQPIDDTCRTLRVFDDGSGEALYVGGDFTVFDGQDIWALARWDGRTWAQVGEGLVGRDQQPAIVSNLLVLDRAEGDLLIAYGGFEIDGVYTTYAAWDGVSWRDGREFIPSGCRYVSEVSTPRGIRLFGTGTDTLWIRSSGAWKRLSDDYEEHASGIAVGDFGGGESVFFAGGFTQIDGVPADGFARVGCPRCPGDYDADGDADTADVIAYFDFWTAGDRVADTTGDGRVDIRDALAFLNVWAQGCP